MDTRTAINVLREVKRDPIEGYGVCNNFAIEASKYLHRKDMEALQRLVDFSKYPGFSGSIKYPLPGGEARYNLCVFHQDFWSGKDGEERFKFVNWCISELEKQL